MKTQVKSMLRDDALGSTMTLRGREVYPLPLIEKGPKAHKSSVTGSGSMRKYRGDVRFGICFSVSQGIVYH